MRTWTTEQAKALAYYRSKAEQAMKTGEKFLILIDAKLFPASIPMEEIQQACGMEDEAYIDGANGTARGSR